MSRRTLHKLYQPAFVEQLRKTGHRGKPEFDDDRLVKIEVVLLYTATLTGRDPVIWDVFEQISRIAEAGRDLSDLISDYLDGVEFGPPSLPGVDDPESLIVTLRAMASAIDTRTVEMGCNPERRGRRSERPTIKLMVHALAQIYREAGGYVSANTHGEFADFLGLLAEFLPDYLHSHIREKEGVSKPKRVSDWFASQAKFISEDVRSERLENN